MRKRRSASTSRSRSPATQTDRLAAVVLHFGDPDETRLAVRSLLASRRPIDDLIVVDNDPACRSWPPSVMCAIASSTWRALGTSGIRRHEPWDSRGPRARGRTVLLVNNDVIVPPDAIGKLEGALASGSASWRRWSGRPVSHRPGPDRDAGYVISLRDGPHASCGVRPHERGAVTERLIDGRRRRHQRLRDARQPRRHRRRRLPRRELLFRVRGSRLVSTGEATGLSSAIALDANVYHEGGRAMGVIRRDGSISRRETI